MNLERLREGWYLMSARDVEIELRRWRGEPVVGASDALAVSQEEAIAFRDAGNVPDELDRSLRLVLLVSSPEDLASLDLKRLRYEPDMHDAPAWRRWGSRPINIIPLHTSGVQPRSLDRWTDDRAMAEMEAGWQESGRVRGIEVDGDVRGFVYKTVVGLEAAGRPITVATITDSLRRWLSAEDVERVRSGLREAER